MHPSASNSSDLPLPDPALNPFPNGLSIDTVRKLILSFPSHSSPGPTGLRPSHLKDALHLPNNPILVNSFLSAISRFICAAAANHFPPTHAPLLASAILIAIPKKTDGVRPIAVSNTLRRLVSKALVHTHIKHIRDKLYPLQLGVGVRDAPPLTLNQLRHFSSISDPSHLILQIDLANAFNTISRHTISNSLSSITPYLANWFYFTHSTPAPLFHSGGTLLSKTGVQQGDPLSPILFAIGIHPIISRLPSVSPNTLTSWYLDDGTSLGPPTEIMDTYNFLLNSFPPADLRINANKCRISSLAPNPTLPTSLLDIPFSPWDEGLTVLGLPLGSSSAISAFLIKTTEKIKALTDRLPSLNHPQAALALIRHSLATPRVVHLLRGLPPHLLGDFPHLCANIFAACLQSSVHLPLTARSWAQATLPVSKGGLGLINPVTFSPISFLSGYFAQRDFLRSHGDPLHILPSLTNETMSIIPSLRPILSYSNPAPVTALLNDPSLLRDFYIPDKPFVHSHYWHSLASDALFQSLISSSTARDRLRLFTIRNSLSWVRLPLPNPTRLLLHPIPPASFPLAVKRILGIPLTPERQTLCPTCTTPDDPYGDHTLSCHHSPQFHQRHDALRDAIHAILPPFSAQKEVTIQGRRRPADLLIPLPIDSRPTAVDFTVVSAIRLSHSPHPYANGATAEAEKKKYDASQAICSAHNTNFLPAAIDTFGGFGPSAAILFSNLPVSESLAKAVALHTIFYHTSTQLLSRYGPTTPPPTPFIPFPHPLTTPPATTDPSVPTVAQQNTQHHVAERAPRKRLPSPTPPPTSVTHPRPHKASRPNPTNPDPRSLPPQHCPLQLQPLNREEVRQRILHLNLITTFSPPPQPPPPGGPYRTNFSFSAPFCFQSSAPATPTPISQDKPPPQPTPQTS